MPESVRVRATIYSHSLGSVAPYVAAGFLMLPPAAYTARSTYPSAPEACIFVDVSQRYQVPLEADLTNYSWDLARPELSPWSLVGVVQEYSYEAYEPFIASEGWREISALEGPVMVREEPRSIAFIDEYDQSAIGLYGN
jgi:hypothetical protein